MKTEKENTKSKTAMLRKFYRIAKDNTPQIAIMIPIAIALFGVLINYFLYLLNMGYYNYFGIDGSYMLPYNRSNFYQYISQFALFCLYWGYAVFAFRIFLVKGCRRTKISVFIGIPFLLNIIMTYGGIQDGTPVWALVIASIILIPVHWMIVFALGYTTNTILRKEAETDTKKKEEDNTKGGWGDEIDKIVVILLFLVFCVVVFGSGYISGRAKAEQKKQFGIVEIDEGQYAVIDANDSELILQKCVIGDGVLNIDSSTYLRFPNEIIIKFETFESIEINIIK